jgi:hypothetical protein
MHTRPNEIYHCTCCERELDPSKMTWLEKSFKTNRWYKGDTCPPEESQGNFPFGTACAKTTLRKQKEAGR